MSSLIVALDPGETTGVATYTGEEKVPPAIQVDGPLRLATWLEEALAWTASGTIVCEDFKVTAQTLKKGRQHASLELIGVARYLAYREGWGFELQTPGDAKRFATDDRLRTLGWYRPAQPHANDALRHLLTHLVKKGDEELLARASKAGSVEDPDDS